MPKHGSLQWEESSLPPPQGASLGWWHPPSGGPWTSALNRKRSHIVFRAWYVSFAVADTWPLKYLMKPSTWSTLTPLNACWYLCPRSCVLGLLPGAALEVPFFLPSLLLPPSPECRATWEPGFWLQPPFFTQLVGCLVIGASHVGFSSRRREATWGQQWLRVCLSCFMLWWPSQRLAWLFFFFKHTVFSGLLRLGKPWAGIAQD